MVPNREQLILEVGQLIVESVNLKHVDPSTISADTELVNSGLELDSIDILEIVVALEQRFDVKIMDTDDGKQIFRSVGTIVDFVYSQQK